MSDKSIKKFIFAGAITTWFFRIISLLNGLVAMPLIVSHLGKAHYGIWVLTGQAISFLVLSDIGGSNAISRFIAQYKGTNDLRSISVLLSTSFALMLFCSLFITIITFSITPFMPNLLNIPKEYSKISKDIFYILGISLAIQFPTRLGIGILSGFQMYGPHGIGKIIDAIFHFLAIILLTFTGKLTLINLALATSILTILTQFIFLYIAWKLTKPWNISINNLSLKMLKKIFGYGSSSILLTVSKMLYDQGITIAVGRFLGINVVALYGVALGLMRNLQPIITAIGTAIPTLSSELFAKQKVQDLKNIVFSTSKIMIAWAVSLSCILYLYADKLLRILLHKSDWSDSEYALASKTIFIMCVGLTIGLPLINFKSMLQSIGKHWQVTNVTLAISAAMLIATIFSLKNGRGITSAAFAWGMVFVAQGLLFYLPMTCKVFGQSVIELLYKNYFPGFLTFLIVFLSGKAVSYFVSPENIVNLFINCAVCIFFSGVSMLIISGYFRKKLFKFAQGYRSAENGKSH